MHIEFSQLNNKNLIACYVHAVMSADHYMMLANLVITNSGEMPNEHFEKSRIALDSATELFAEAQVRGISMTLPYMSDLQMYDLENTEDEPTAADNPDIPDYMEQRAKARSVVDALQPVHTSDGEKPMTSGQLYDLLGTLMRDQGVTTGDQGELVDDQGELVDDQGELVGAQGVTNLE